MVELNEVLLKKLEGKRKWANIKCIANQSDVYLLSKLAKQTQKATKGLRGHWMSIRKVS